MAVKIEHTAVYVKDLEGMKDFYVKYFGAVPNDMYYNPKTGLKTYFLSFGGESRLELMNKPVLGDKEKEETFGYIHLAFAPVSYTHLRAHET